MEGHKALVHTAAASNLGQMLNKICLEQGVELVNIVRSQQQVDILKDIGAKIVLDSSSENFKAELYQAIDQTGATLAFDAIGGGELVSDILTMMEASGSKDAKGCKADKPESVLDFNTGNVPKSCGRSTIYKCNFC